MGSVLPRPVDNVTDINLLAGLPYFTFTPELTGGGFGSPVPLGIVDAAALAKTVTLQQLKDHGSGSGRIVRELVSELEATLNIGVFNWQAEVFRFAMASATLTALSAGTKTATAEAFSLTGSGDALGDVFIDLVNRDIRDGFGSEITTLDTATITDEVVGTGQGGTFGEVAGDFALDFAIGTSAADITGYTETLNGVPNDRTGDLVDGAPTAGQIGITIGTGATSGEITYPSGEAPAAGIVITCTYQPSSAATFTENTDFSVDPIPGRIRVTKGTGTPGGLRDLQPMVATYDYNGFAGQQLAPFTQNVFQGKGELLHMPDVGVNFVWQIPKLSIKINDDELAFSKDSFAVLNLAITLLDNGGTSPYGLIDIYDELAA